MTATVGNGRFPGLDSLLPYEEVNGCLGQVTGRRSRSESMEME